MDPIDNALIHPIGSALIHLGFMQKEHRIYAVYGTMVTLDHCHMQLQYIQSSVRACYLAFIF